MKIGDLFVVEHDNKHIYKLLNLYTDELYNDAEYAVVQVIWTSDLQFQKKLLEKPSPWSEGVFNSRCIPVYTVLTKTQSWLDKYAISMNDKANAESMLIESLPEVIISGGDHLRLGSKIEFSDHCFTFNLGRDLGYIDFNDHAKYDLIVRYIERSGADGTNAPDGAIIEAKYLKGDRGPIYIRIDLNKDIECIRED